MLSNGTKFHINDTLYSSKSTRNFLSFKDIRKNGYHIETMNEGNKESLYITSIIYGKNIVEEKLLAFSPRLYHTTIKPIESYDITNQEFNDPKIFTLWHNRLVHLGSSMMRRIIEQSHGHPLKNQREFPCDPCSQGKLIVRPSFNKIVSESPVFLERIHGDICGTTHPLCRPFRYFMVLIDASTRWSHVSLLSTRNVAFVKLLAQMTKLRAQFPDYPIKTIRLDNAGEFTSQTLNDYCMSIGINIEHPVTHVHTQNGLVDFLINRLQSIARPLLMKTKLPTSTWGHAIMHAASLLELDQHLTISTPLHNLY